MRKLYALFLVAAVPTVALAAPPLEELQHDWSVCQYQTLEAKKENCFSSLRLC